MNVTEPRREHDHSEEPVLSYAGATLGAGDTDGPAHRFSLDAGFGPVPPEYITPEPGRFGRFLIRLTSRAPRWSAPVVVAACFAGAASYVWISNPTDSSAADIPTCIIKLTTGLDCPGCGGTRAFYYLMHGNVPEAARHHVMAVFAAPFLVWFYLAWTVKHIWGKSIPTPKVSAKTISIYLGLWAVFMVVRNLPWAPFTSLYV